VLRIGVPVALAACLLGAREGAAQAAPQPAPRMASSSLASVEVHVNARKAGGQWYAEDAGLSGPSRIAITYGQPHARGRRIEGGLIPTDTVWRFGANMATALHTDVDLRLGSLAVPAGDYTLFLLNARTGWSLIVSRATAEWGTDYDASREFGRVALASRTMAEAEPSLSIYLVPEARPGAETAELRGVLRIKWGMTELSANWQVQP
jgi:Protein of unknown function (DUF2911)